MPNFEKGDDETLDYSFDFSGLLADGESIATVDSVDIDQGLTENTNDRAKSSSAVTIWVTGGTPGTHYDATCIVTSDSSPPRTYERTMTIEVVDEKTE